MVQVTGNLAEFKFYRPKAKKVYIAGDFNGWRVSELAMEKTAEGYWTARLELPAGDFRFRYLADGEWFTDFAAFGIEYGAFGPDGVVRVGASKRRAARTRSRLQVATA